MSETIEQPVMQKKLAPPICKDFDGDCFQVVDKEACHKDHGYKCIDGKTFYLEPAIGICPFL